MRRKIIKLIKFILEINIKIYNTSASNYLGDSVINFYLPQPATRMDHPTTKPYCIESAEPV